MDTKYSRWAFTAYEDQYAVIDAYDKLRIKEIGYQDEICPDTGRKHRQGYFATTTPLRFSAARKLFPSVHIEPAKNWTALVKYCQKSESRDPAGNTVRLGDPSNPPTHVRVDMLMEMIAELVLLDTDINDDNYAEHPQCKDVHTDAEKAAAKAQYWEMCRNILLSRPELASLIMQPGPQNLWLNTRSTWMRRQLTARATSNSITASSIEHLPPVNFCVQSINASCSEEGSVVGSSDTSTSS
jgi:hypothetical protein